MAGDKSNVLGALCILKVMESFTITSIGTDGQYANSNGTSYCKFNVASDGANLDMFSFGNGVTHTKSDCDYYKLRIALDLYN